MGHAYVIRDQFGQYFVTFTVNQWVDVFSRQEYADLFLDSVRFCQKEKGLKVHAWVIMTNHIHMIISSDKVNLSDIIRDLKKYTSTQIINAIKNNPQESRKNWFLWLLQKKEGGKLFWKEGYHGEEIISESFFQSKLEYIQMNPVKAGIVEKEEEYVYSSCGYLYGVRKGLIELEDS